MSGMRKRSSWVLTCLALLAASAHAQSVDETPLGSPVERQLPTDHPPATPWARDPEQITTEAGDRLEKRKLLSESFETVKLKNVIPPIHFESGVAILSAGDEHLRAGRAAAARCMKRRFRIRRSSGWRSARGPTACRTTCSICCRSSPVDTYLSVEYGMQTMHDRSLDWMNRGHHHDAILDAMERSRGRGFEICAHVILGPARRIARRHAGDGPRTGPAAAWTP